MTVTRSDEIREKVADLRNSQHLDTDRQLKALEIEMLAEINNTLVYIKENTRGLERSLSDMSRTR